MSTRLKPIERCQEIAGLAPHEIVIGVTPGKKHERLLSKYRCARRSQTVVRARIVADLRAAVRAGAISDAADLLIVLRRLLSLDSRVAPARPAGVARRSRGDLRRSAPAPISTPGAAKAPKGVEAQILPFAAR